MSETVIMSRLKELRSTRGVSQEAAAEGCGISRIALARYENGTRVPVVEIAAKLADYYGVSVDYLMGRETPSTTPTPPQQKAPSDMRAEAMMLLEAMDDATYQTALKVLRALNQEGK